MTTNKIKFAPINKDHIFTDATKPQNPKTPKPLGNENYIKILNLAFRIENV